MRVQVYLLPLDRPGEARRLTNLPRGVDEFAWSPDGSRLAVVSSSHGATIAEDARRRGRPAQRPPSPGEPPTRTSTTSTGCAPRPTGAGWVYHQVSRLWVVDARSARQRLVHAGRAPVVGAGLVARRPAGSRSARIAGRDDDLGLQQRRVGRGRRRRPGHQDDRRQRPARRPGLLHVARSGCPTARPAGGPRPSLRRRRRQPGRRLAVRRRWLGVRARAPAGT